MSDVLVCILTGGVAAAGIKLIESVIVWRLNRKAKKEDDNTQKEVEKKKHDEAKYEELVSTVENLKTANRLLMYDRIKHLCRSYLRAGEIDFNDLEDLVEMHDCYHKGLGGNGKLKELMELVEELPIKK